MIDQDTLTMTAQRPRGTTAARLIEVAGVAILGTLMSLVVLYPALGSWSRRMLGGSWDSGQNLWNLWWVNRAAASGNLFPFHTDMLYHPTGVSLAFHPLAPLNGWVGTLLHSGFGLSLPAVYNSIAFAETLISFLGAYLLVKFVTHDRWAALLGATIFAFSPHRTSRIHYGHLESYGTEFIPFLAWFLLKMNATMRWRYVIGAALMVGLTSWISLTLLLCSAVMSALLLVWDLRLNRTAWSLMKRWLVFCGLSAILVLPAVLPMGRDYGMFSDQADQRDGAVRNSPDLLGFVLPNQVTSPVMTQIWSMFGVDTEQLFVGLHGRAGEREIFIGYTVLLIVLAGILLWRAQRGQIVRWWLVAFGSAMLVLGPVIHAGGSAIVPSPIYVALAQFPLISFNRTPARNSIILMLALAVLAGLSAAALMRRWPRTRFVVVLLPVFVFAEYLSVPFELDRRYDEVSPYFAALAERADGPVLNVPIDLFGAFGPACDYMVYQTIHGKPIVGGYISRTPNAVMHIYDRAFLNELRARVYDDAEPYDFSPEELAQGRRDLDWLGARYIVLHKDVLATPDVEVLRHALTETIGAPEYEDERLVAWAYRPS